MSTDADETGGYRRILFGSIVVVVVVLPMLFVWWWVKQLTADEAVREAVQAVGGRFHAGADTGTWIDLSNSRVDDGWLEAQRDGLTRLHTIALDLRNSGVTGAGLAALDGIDTINNVELAGTVLTDTDGSHLSALPRLVTLNIAHTGISDAGLNVLVKLPMLNAVTIDRTQATPQGAASLAGCSQLRGVTLLDADAQCVSTLQGLRLFGLALRGESLDVSCLPALKQFAGLKSLTLYDSHFTDVELEVLRQSLSGCRVEQLDYATVEAAQAAAWKRAER